MKRLFLLPVLVCLISFNLQAQDSDQALDVLNRKHEVRLGTVKLLATGIFEASYEYVQDSNRGFGATVLVNLNTDNEYFENYSFTPFYRMYFQSHEDYGAKGFFVEGFSSFFGGENYDNLFLFGLEQDSEKFFDISLGLALGKKWINTSGFVFEVKVGAGRNLLKNGSEFDALLKGDLSIGYRF